MAIKNNAAEAAPGLGCWQSTPEDKGVYMQNSLLAHIASNFISEYENVANSSVAYMLNNYSAARKALACTVGLESVPEYYITELSTQANGRPDVTGLDSSGNRKIIIEGKFWANLTDNQPNNYIKELAHNGRILFLSPDKRVVSLKVEIEKRLNDKFYDDIVICSWSTLLSRIEHENNKIHNSRLSSDLFQLRELCQKMDVEGMPPLSESDLDPMHGRIASNFADIIDECNAILREWESSDFNKLKTTPQKYGYGFYFKACGFGCYLHFDTNKWFTRKIGTPVWLSIQDNNWNYSYKISHFLREYDPTNSIESDYGIIFHPGMDKADVTHSIVEKVKDVLEMLSSKFNNEKQQPDL